MLVELALSHKMRMFYWIICIGEDHVVCSFFLSGLSYKVYIIISCWLHLPPLAIYSFPFTVSTIRFHVMICVFTLLLNVFACAGEPRNECSFVCCQFGGYYFLF